MKNPYKQDHNFDITKDLKVWYARAKFGQEEIDAVVKCLKEFQLSPGKYTFEFERKVAKLFGKEYAVMVNSGSSALLLAAELLDIKPGDEIISAGSGFPTTINPFLLKGAKVVLVDVDYKTLSPKLDQVRNAITNKTRAIVLAHIWGATLDMPALRKIANEYNLTLIEDSCDSIGARIQGNSTGTWSDISVTSFYPSHVITAGGGGGMICVKTEEEEKRLRVFRDWGRMGTDSENLDERFGIDIDGIPYDAKFFYGVRGYNLKATEIQAAFGLVQLRYLREWNATRQGNYGLLKEIVENLGMEVVEPQAQMASPSWLAFPFFSKDRIELAKFLERRDIQTRPILAGNFLRHPAFKGANIEPYGELLGADYVAKHGLGVGLHQEMTNLQFNEIENALKEFAK